MVEEPVTIKLLPVAVVNTKPVVETVLPVIPVNTPLVLDTVVAMRLVVVTVPKLPFQRKAAVPRDKVLSRFGLRLVKTEPGTQRLVEVTF